MSEEEKQLQESLRITSEQRRQRRKMNMDIYRQNKENQQDKQLNSSMINVNSEETRSSRRKSEMMLDSKLPPKPLAKVVNDSDNENEEEVAVDVVRAGRTHRADSGVDRCAQLFNDFQLDYFKLIRKTSMLNFILTPPPQGTIIRCKIICRKGIFNEYSFYLEDAQHNDILLMKTHRQMTTAKAAHIITCLNTATAAPPTANSFSLTDFYSASAGSSQYIAGIELPCAKLKSNISRKKFKLELDTNVIGASSTSSSSSSSSPRNTDLLSTLFKSSLSEPRRIMANACLCSGVSFNQDKVTYFFKNRPPYYDFQQRKYVLDYGGRAKQSSKNNFQIIDESSDEMIMQLGKVETGWYNCDFSFPLCALQAFGFALSSLCR